MDLRPLLSDTALAFRGFNMTNLGRSHELLNHANYGPVVRQYLEEGSEICSESTGKHVNLVDRVENQRETALDDYAEAITLIVVMEQAQLRLLADFHDTDYHHARLSVGFSLGEISALIAGGVYETKDALRIPLEMSADCVDLAHEVQMAIVFSRRDAIPMDRVDSLCLQINARGQGVIGISTYLSPNSFLILGTGDTIDVFRQHLKEIMKERIYLRMNDHQWPPLHTPIVWNRNIPNRSQVMLHTLPGGMVEPHPNVLSLVTGTMAYTNTNSRTIIANWIDHTQRLWDVINELLASGIETIIHVGPQPNIIPATFERIATNVEVQTRSSRRMRAASAVARRPWLQAILPRRAALLRAPLIRHVTLEDWLLEPQGENFQPDETK